MEAFKALVVDNSGDYSLGVKVMHPDDLPPGEVTIQTAYSGVNFKDALAAGPEGRVVRKYPMVPGIDLAGIVVDSKDPRYRKGDKVLVTGYELGTGHFGGYSEFARVPGNWIVPLPSGLTLREAMIVGTAGFTAALSIYRLEANGLRPENGPVLVKGATGGVGSHAVAMLANKGYTVVASSGKKDAESYLLGLGARQVIDRNQLNDHSGKALNKEQWAAAVDPVGGPALSYLLSTVQYGGAVALSGLTGGTDFSSTVMPFILRGVHLFGIDSVYCETDLRRLIWEEIAGVLKTAQLEEMIHKETVLDHLPEEFEKILSGTVRGRIVVRL